MFNDIGTTATWTLNWLSYHRPHLGQVNFIPLSPKPTGLEHYLGDLVVYIDLHLVWSADESDRI